MGNQPPQEPQTPITPETPPQPQQQATPPVAPNAKVPPTLGFVGHGLAVLGTILACIPAILIVGVIVLFAAFVVSLIAILKKNTTKWPAIVGLILSAIAGTLAAILFVIALAVNIAERVNQDSPTDAPSTSEQMSDSSNDDAENRPSPDVIAKEVAAQAKKEGLTTYDDMPEFYPCMGRELYNSDVSDESLWLVIKGDDPIESERTLAFDAIQNATLTCDPQ